jgi:membrane protein
MTDHRGRDAASPLQMPRRGWLDVLKRSWREMSEDNLSLIAAGIAFYAFTAMVPLLAAIVLSYGLFASPEAVVRQVQQLSALLPADAARLIGEQLANVVATAATKKGIGLVAALALAFWGATKAAGAIVTALNVAYEEEEKRGFVKRTLLNLTMVLGAVLAAGLAMAAIAIFAQIDDLLPGAPAIVVMLGRLASWIILAAIGAAGVATLYRYGPDRDAAKWTWLTPGSIFVAVGWAVSTAGFGFYVANFGNYGATYGSLSAVIVLLTWLYLSAMLLLLGAELNSELEHQTARDTTQGPERPLGTRGAAMADRVAPDEENANSPAPARSIPDPVSSKQGPLPFGLSVSEALLIVLLAVFGRRRHRHRQAAE